MVEIILGFLLCAIGGVCIGTLQRGRLILKSAIIALFLFAGAFIVDGNNSMAHNSHSAVAYVRMGR